MTEDQQTEQTDSLGAYLRRRRREKNYSLEDVQRETRIPAKTLKAMEEDDYALLPAEAFARGFYMLYAKCLDLDQQSVLQRYQKECLRPAANKRFSTPTKQEKQVNTLAAPPSRSTSSALGFSLVVLIAAIALLSWYFSWNPATFISSKLQNLQEQQHSTSDNTVPEQGPSQSSPRDTAGDNHYLTQSNYFLTIDFLEDTTITITIDNGLPTTEAYARGSTRSWYAEEKINLLLAAPAEVELLFNGSEIDLPQPQDGVIAITLP